MAAMRHGADAALRHRRFVANNVSLLKPVFFVSSSFASFPATHSRRKNRLRQKILKTMKPTLPPANPIFPVESPSKENKEFDLTKEIQEFKSSDLVEGEETQETEEVEVEMPAGVGTDVRISLAGKNSILKYGLWFVGAFVFQTVFAVMVLGLDEIDHKRGTENGSGESRSKDVVLDLNTVIGDGHDNAGKLEMESKIAEIRLMAREVRERERLQSKWDGEGSDGGKYLKSEIEEEVNGTMGRLRKKLEKTRFTKTKRGNGTENSDLLYEKKYKFKDFSFIGSDDSRVDGGIEGSNEILQSRSGDDVGLGDGKKQTELSDDDLKEVDAVHVVEVDNKKGMLETTENNGNTRRNVTKERETSKQGRKKGVAKKPKVTDGNALEKHNGTFSLEPVKSRKQNVEGVQSGKSSDSNTGVVSVNLSKGKGTFRGKGFGNTKLAVKSKNEGLWWSNLPYVLVIFMQRGDGGEGLYTLKSGSSTENQISFTVAFEDRVDANNFCYLLESFFEDLGDFKADVVPLTVKELKEAEESYSLRAVVVKKGQLKLYAGQPLTDAEMALRSMIEQH